MVRSTVLKRLAVAVVVAVGTMGLTAGSAMAWTPTGNYNQQGSLTYTLQTPGTPSYTCDTNADVDLYSGIGNDALVTHLDFSNCTTTATNCTVGLAAIDLPWESHGTLMDAPLGYYQIDGVRLAMTFTGAACAMGNGTRVDMTGSLTGDYDGSIGTLSFPSASGVGALVVAPGSSFSAGTKVVFSGNLFMTNPVIPELS